MSQTTLLYSDLTEKIIKAFYHVYNSMGYGFLERVYENALVLTLNKWGIKAQPQLPIEVYFEGTLVGVYYADIVVNDCVMIELKAAETIHDAHEAQLLNYLKATTIEVGLLLNFGPRPSFRRKVFANTRKQIAKSNPGDSTSANNPTG